VFLSAKKIIKRQGRCWGKKEKLTESQEGRNVIGKGLSQWWVKETAFVKDKEASGGGGRGRRKKAGQINRKGGIVGLP